MPNPGLTIDTITTVLTFIMLISNFILMIVMWVDKAKTPERDQNDRIAILEEKVKKLSEERDKEKNKIKEIEQGNVVTQEAILALLSHSIDGNNTAGLTKARDNLQTYLTHKGVATA